MATPARRGGAFAPLAESQFRLLFTGQTISLLGDGMLGVALSFAVLGLTGSASDLGYVFAARGIPLGVFLLVAGVFADRLPRRTVMIAADVTRFAGQGITALLLLTGHAQLWEIAGLQAVYGAATAFFYPASTGLLPLTVSNERLQQANGLRAMSMASGNIAGPAIAGLLVATVGSGWALAADSLSFAGSVIFLAQIRLPDREKLPKQTLLRDAADGWREFRSRTWVWTFVVAAAVGNFMTPAFTVLGADISKRNLGGAGAWALILAAEGAGAVAGGFATARVTVKRPLVAASLGLAALAPPYALLGLGAPAAAIAPAAFVAGAGLMFSNSLWETTLQRYVPSHVLSRVSAYDWLGSIAFSPLGFIVVGPAAAAFGTTATLLVAAGWFAISSLSLAVLYDTAAKPVTSAGNLLDQTSIADSGDTGNAKPGGTALIDSH